MNASPSIISGSSRTVRPEWLSVLAQACGESSQNKVAKRLGVSAAMISNVLKGKYRGDMARIEDLVQGVFMNGVINCPAIGEIPISDCRGWRAKAKKFSPTNRQRVVMFRACRACEVCRSREVYNAYKY